MPTIPGGAMEDADFASAAFDLRCHYVAGNVPSGGPCGDCSTGCFVDGASCANSEGCAWWGCWQWDQDPPGRFVADFLSDTAAAGAVPMITQYIWYSVAGDVEGAPECSGLPDTFGGLARCMLAIARAEAPNVLVGFHASAWGAGADALINSDPGFDPARGEIRPRFR